MSDVEWDADDYEPPQANPTRPTDKWDGEDEEDEIKDNWDDEEEEKERLANETGTGTGAPLVKKKKKKIVEIIAEKEAKQLEERERRKKEAEELEAAQTPEAILAEKMRLQKIQEDADLQLASDLVGTGGSISEEDNKLLDDIDLSSSSGLNSFRKALISKIRSVDKLEKRPYFVTFVEDICRDLCQNIESEEVKRVSTILNSIYNEKVRASKPKNKRKTAGKAKLNLGQGTIADDLNDDYGGFNEYDDFI